MWRAAPVNRDRNQQQLLAACFDTRLDEALEPHGSGHPLTPKYEASHTAHDDNSPAFANTGEVQAAGG